MNLHVLKGTKILFSTKPEDYLPLVYTRWEGISSMLLSKRTMPLPGKALLTDNQRNQLVVVERHFW